MAQENFSEELQRETSAVLDVEAYRQGYPHGEALRAHVPELAQGCVDRFLVSRGVLSPLVEIATGE